MDIAIPLRPRWTCCGCSAPSMNFLDAAEIDRIAGGGHPHSNEVGAALTAVAGAVPVQQLKVSFSGRCRRRVLLPENATLGLLHTYDFGASLRHEITLEEVLDQHPLAYPECLTGKGDNPVEYHDPDDPEPLDVGTVNKRLRRLVR